MVLSAMHLFIAAPPAQAVTCVFDPNTHFAHVERAGTSGGTLVISRTGDTLTAAGIACGSVAPVGGANTVEKVFINMDGLCCESLLFALTNGQLGPGFNDESGESDEIEFEVSNVTGVSQLGVFGTDTGEIFTVGSRLLLGEFTMAQTINLNGQIDGGSPDEDVWIRGIPQQIALIGKGGNDQLTAGGTGTFGSDPTFADVAISDGPGADTTAGGFGNDILLADATPDPGDSFFGGSGFDSVDLHFRTVNMSITLNGIADDGADCPGAACEGDNIGSDVERVTTGSGNDHLVGGPGDQEFHAGTGVNTLQGGSGNDALTAGAGTNIFDGGPGNDLLAGDTGSDRYRGGPGFDLVSYHTHVNGVTVTIGEGANDGVPGEQDDVKSDIEALYGSFSHDQLTGSGAADRLFGGPGDDELRGLGGDDWLDGGRTLFGPISTGVDGSDVFFGGLGIDTVTEAAHVGDLLLSIDGVANDFVLGDASQGIDDINTDVENVIGGPGDDTIRGSGQRNVLTGGSGNDTLLGLAQNDILIPNSGLDDLRGGTGADEASYATSGSPVTVHLGQGTATGQGADELTEIERATGSAHDDHLTGSSAPNTLIAGAGDDILFGLAANDRLFGQADDDTFNGGAGNDLCNQSGGTGTKTGCES